MFRMRSQLLRIGREVTEPEYVEHIRSVAVAYLAKIEAHEHGIALGTTEELAWIRTKESLSPFTIIELCRTWLDSTSAKVAAAVEDAEPTKEGGK